MPAIQADPESMPANDVIREFSGTFADSGVDSGSASEFEPVVFARSEADPTFCHVGARPE